MHHNHSFINSSATATASSMELSAGMKAHGMLMLLGWGLFLLPGSAVRASSLVDLQGITAPSLFIKIYKGLQHPPLL